MEAVIIAILAALGLGVAVYAKGRSRGSQTADQAKTKAMVNVATAEDARAADTRAVRGSALAREVAKIHTEVKAEIASKPADRAEARRLLKESAWDDGSSF